MRPLTLRTATPPETSCDPHPRLCPRRPPVQDLVRDRHGVHVGAEVVRLLAAPPSCPLPHPPHAPYTLPARHAARQRRACVCNLACCVHMPFDMCMCCACKWSARVIYSSLAHSAPMSPAYAARGTATAPLARTASPWPSASPSARVWRPLTPGRTRASGRRARTATVRRSLLRPAGATPNPSAPWARVTFLSRPFDFPAIKCVGCRGRLH